MNVILYFQTAAAAGNAPDQLIGAVEMAERFHCRIQQIDDPISPRTVKQLISFWNPLGAIVECGARAESFDPRIFESLPTVFFNAPLIKPAKNRYFVRHDSPKAGMAAARVFLNAGYSNFAYINHPQASIWNSERARAFAEALKLNSQSCLAFSYPPGPPARHHQSLEKFLRALPHPAGILAANDRVAADVIATCSHAGLRIPEDIAILGVDNILSICEHTQPTLSSIAPDFRRGGNLAILLLVAVRRAKGRFKGSHERYFGSRKIVQRASTLILKRRDPEVVAALEFIRKKACSGATAAQAAALFKCSRRMADIRFTKTVGHSILTEIQNVRLERAKELLSNPLQELKSLHDFCGFSTANALRKFFRQETGMTMSEWRQKSSRQRLPGI